MNEEKSVEELLTDILEDDCASVVMDFIQASPSLPSAEQFYANCEIGNYERVNSEFRLEWAQRGLFMAGYGDQPAIIDLLTQRAPDSNERTLKNSLKIEDFPENRFFTTRGVLYENQTSNVLHGEALHGAIEALRFSLVKKLLSGAFCSGASQEETCLFKSALRSGSTEMCNLVKPHCSHELSADHTQAAIHSGNLDLVRSTPLQTEAMYSYYFYALMRGFKHIAQLFEEMISFELFEGVGIYFRGACLGGNKELVKKFLKLNLENESLNEGFFMAAMAGNTDVVMMLHEKIADVKSALYAAVSRNHIECANQLLVARSSDVDLSLVGIFAATYKCLPVLSLCLELRPVDWLRMLKIMYCFGFKAGLKLVFAMHRFALFEVFSAVRLCVHENHWTLLGCTFEKFTFSRFQLTELIVVASECGSAESLNILVENNAEHWPKIAEEIVMYYSHFALKMAKYLKTEYLDETLLSAVRWKEAKLVQCLLEKGAMGISAAIEESLCNGNRRITQMLRKEENSRKKRNSMGKNVKLKY